MTNTHVFPCSMGPNNMYRPVIVLIILLFQCVSSLSESESEVLFKFKGSLGNNVKLLSWDPSKPPCGPTKSNWAGIICNEGKVWGIKLENMGLSGAIDVESLEQLVNLRTISLMNNSFSGTFPKLNKVVALKTVYLSGNRFSGKMDPAAFEGMRSLKKIHLGNNELSGSIPSSLATLPKLVELFLDGNKFTGKIPDFKLGMLRTLNVSNNHLEGQIPASLSKMDPRSFSGNGNLCGAPLPACPPPTSPPQTSGGTTPPPSPPSSSSSNTPPVTTIALIAAGAVLLLAILVIIIAAAIRKHGQKSQTGEGSSITTTAATDVEKGLPPNSAAASGSSRKGENSAKLTFLRDDVEKFELGDLLKASAEVLGSGHLGASYRAALANGGKAVVVKRFRHMSNVGREEFQEHMRRIGRLTHPNLLPLLAFYYRKEEKLLVSDYVDNLNLAVHLHGNRSAGQQSPDWATRLRIIKGVARGLQYLYTELPSLALPHGHLKSSNVLLTPTLDPLLTDYTLVPVINQDHARDAMVAYKSPEFRTTARVNKKTDVWSLGILILEVLTGKGTETDLVRWVEGVLEDGDQGYGGVFDKEMGEVAGGSEGQMVKLLKIGLACARDDVERRWDLKEAVARIEEVKEKDG